MREFNVIGYNFNSKEFVPYNIIPYLVSQYKIKRDKPKTFDEVKEFVKKESMHQWWARCEYEIVLSPWPYTLSPSERAKEENNVEAWKEHWKKHLNECEKIDVIRLGDHGYHLVRKKPVATRRCREQRS